MDVYDPSPANAPPDFGFQYRNLKHRRDDDEHDALPASFPSFDPAQQQQQQQQQQHQQQQRPQDALPAPRDDSDDDENLSFQTLNADGTPKRPMNAFLLYAKKRRPQISTSHPTMRTGEISKVLSKEWQGMSRTDKQYYQDKAKKLKDTFNTRWPDYVYKRRPNNSRKKRKVPKEGEGFDGPGQDVPPSVSIPGAPDPEASLEALDPAPALEQSLVSEQQQHHHHEEQQQQQHQQQQHDQQQQQQQQSQTQIRHSPAPPPPDHHHSASDSTNDVPYPGQPSHLDPRSQPVQPQSAVHRPPPQFTHDSPSMNPRLAYANPHPQQSTYPPYDEYSAQWTPQDPSSRLPPVWASYDPRPTYEPERPVGMPPSYPPEEPQWARPNGHAIDPQQWQNVPGPSAAPPPRASSRNQHHSLSATQSPAPSPSDPAFAMRRPRNWPQNSPSIPEASLSGARPSFSTLTAPLYSTPHHVMRPPSPPSSAYYTNGTGTPGGYNGSPYPARSPLLPSLDHHHHQVHPSAYPPHQAHRTPSGHYSQHSLPPIMGSTPSGHIHTPPPLPHGTPTPPHFTPPRHPDDGINAHDLQHRTSLVNSVHSFAGSRSSSIGDIKPRADGPPGLGGLPMGLDPANAMRPPSVTDFTPTHHNSYWDPVKSEAGE